MNFLPRESTPSTPFPGTPERSTGHLLQDVADGVQLRRRGHLFVHSDTFSVLSESVRPLRLWWTQCVPSFELFALHPSTHPLTHVPPGRYWHSHGPLDRLVLKLAHQTNWTICESLACQLATFTLIVIATYLKQCLFTPPPGLPKKTAVWSN